MAEPARNDIQVDASIQELGRGVVAQLLSELVIPTLRAYRRYLCVMVSGFHGMRPAGSGENANASSGTSTPMAFALARRRANLSVSSSHVSVQGEAAALPVLRRLFDPLALLDQIVAGQPDLASPEIESVLP